MQGTTKQNTITTTGQADEKQTCEWVLYPGAITPWWRTSCERSLLKDGYIDKHCGMECPGCGKLIVKAKPNGPTN